MRVFQHGPSTWTLTLFLVQGSSKKIFLWIFVQTDLFSHETEANPLKMQPRSLNYLLNRTCSAAACSQTREQMGWKELEEETWQDYLRRTEREQHGALGKPSASPWQTHGLSPEGGGAPALLSLIHRFIITESDVAKRHFPSESIRWNLIKACQMKFF